MRRLAEGDREALRGLFDRHAPLMLGVATTLLRDRHAAEDLVNEVFLEVWEKAGRYAEERAAPRTYLVLLTRSRAVDRLRAGNTLAAGRGETVGPLSDAGGVGSTVGRPEDHAEADELRRIVREELAALTPDQRDSLELAFFAGLTHQEISTQTDTPLGTVKGRVRRGLLQLRDRLKARLGGGSADDLTGGHA